MGIIYRNKGGSCMESSKVEQGLVTHDFMVIFVPKFPW